MTTDPGRGSQETREALQPEGSDPGEAVDDPGGHDSDRHIEAISRNLHERTITREEVEKAVEAVKTEERERKERHDQIREVLQELHEATQPH